MPFILNPYWTSPSPTVEVAFGFTTAPVVNVSEREVADGPYILGYHFTTDFNRQLTRIGIYKPTQADPTAMPRINQPSTLSHSVGIWDFTGPGLPVLIWQQDFLASATCISDTTPTVAPYYCWFDITNGPELDANVDYVVAATWDELSPVIVSIKNVYVIAGGFKLNTTASTQQGAVPGMLIDLGSEPYYVPEESSFLLEKGFFTINMELQRI